MASKEEKKGLPTGAIVFIVLIIIGLIGAVMWYMHTTKGANATAALPNAGTSAPGGIAAVASMPSPTNVSAGTGNGAVGRVGAQV